MECPKCVVVSCLIYRALLRLAPSGYREELGSLLLSDFRQLCLGAYARTGVRGVLVLWPRLLFRTSCDLGLERFELWMSHVRKIMRKIVLSLNEYRISSTHSGAGLLTQLIEHFVFEIVLRYERWRGGK